MSSHTIILFHGKKIYIINKLLQRHTIFLFSPNNIFYHKHKRETEKFSLHTQYIYIEKRTPREKFFKKIFFLSFFLKTPLYNIFELFVHTIGYLYRAVSLLSTYSSSDVYEKILSFSHIFTKQGILLSYSMSNRGDEKFFKRRHYTILVQVYFTNWNINR